MVLTTGNGVQFQISTEDEEFVTAQTWTAFRVRKGKGKEYVYVGRRSGQGQKANKKMLHRWILERMFGEKAVRRMICDHINGDTLDNRRENLRLATYGVNRLNSIGNAGSRSGHQGVHWNSGRNQWVVRLRFGKRDRFFGYYSDLEEAKTMAQKAYSAFKPQVTNGCRL